VISVLLFLTFLTLSGFHFYWLFGGKWGLDQVVPTEPKSAERPPIPPVATLVVAIGLMAIGFF